MTLITGCVTALLLTVPAAAQPACLPPSDDGRHPLFPGLSIRPDREYNADGEVSTARPTSVAFGDLDGDGVLDAVVCGGPQRRALPELSYITVLMGRGAGVFGEPIRYDAGLEECFVEVADIDGDDHLDVLVCNASDDTVGVLRGRGDGTLEAHVALPAGDEPRSLIAEDLDGDGDIDLAALNTLSSDVSVLLGNGDGTFAPQVRIPVPGVTPRGDPNRTFPYPGPFLAAGDLNGDGIPDLAVPAISRVHLLLGDGHGGFADAPAHAQSPLPAVYNVKLADLNGDGALDIASSIATGGVSRMVVWLNGGGGVFDDADEYDSTWDGVGPFYFNIGLAIADLGNDGHPDIAVASELFGIVPIHHNLGDGTFGPAELHPVFAHSWFVSAPDLNTDGHADLAVLSEFIRGALRIHLNDGQTGPVGPAPMPVGVQLVGNTSRHAIDAADLDGDGDTDLAVGVRWTSRFLRRVEILENDGTGSFARTGEVVLDEQGESAVEALVVRDLDGDGRPEVIVADATENGGWIEPGFVRVLANRGGLQFDMHVAHAFANSYPKALCVEDIDGDGRPDIVAYHVQSYPGNDLLPAERRVIVLRNLGNLVFEERADLLVGAVPWPFPHGGVAVGDLTGDGRLDIAATIGTRNAPGEVVVFEGDGAWGFAEVARHTLSLLPHGIAIARFASGDERQLAVLQIPNSGDLDGMEPYLTILRIDGQGMVVLDEHIAATDSQVSTLIDADLDRDGHLDLAWGTDTGGVYVHLGRGDGTFDPPVRYDTLHGAFALEVAGLDGDGRLDFATTSIATETVSVQFNRSCYSPCPGDWTGSFDPDDPKYGVPDLMVTLDDFLYYLDAFAAGGLRADLDGDGDRDADDFFAYLDLFAQGC